MIRPNRYAGKCVNCGDTVPPQAGKLFKLDGKWRVECRECSPDINLKGLSRYDLQGGGPKDIHVIRLSSGQAYTQNANGRCEDAPCCGCCT